MTNKAEAKTLYLPQFVTPPGGEDRDDLSTVQCTDFTHDRADVVAINVIAAMSKMEVNELSSDLITLAFAYISLRNSTTSK